MKVQIFTRKNVNTSMRMCWLVLLIFQGPQVVFAMPGDQETIQLEEAFHRIGQKYEVYFNYDRSITSDIQVEYDKEKHQSLEEALNYVLKNTNLGYKIFDQRFVVIFQNNDQGIESLKEMIGHVQGFLKERETIKEKDARRVAPLRTLTAQEVYRKRLVFGITGTVVDDAGEPLIGVNIQVKATNKGTATDFEGQFTVEDIDENAVLVVSYVGYHTQEVQVAGKSTLSIMLKTDSQLLDEVVVVGYGTQKKVNLTGAVSTLESDDLIKSSFSNTSQALAGQVPGLITKQVSGEPGNDFAELSIRGFGPALVLVDGIETPMNNIDPNEIASISVLKDASAAVYGARAGNGVILITTKRGDSSKPTFNFNTIYSEQSLTTYPRLLDAGRYAELIREGQLNAGIAPSSVRFSEEQVQKYKQGTEPGYQSTNWFNEVMNKTSPMQQYNLSSRGGNNTVRYYTFLGYTGQTGMYKSGDNKLDRFNVRSNIDAQIANNFSVGLDVSLITSKLNSPTRNQSILWQDLQESQPVYPAELPDPSRIAYTGMVISTLASTTNELGGYVRNNDDQISGTLNLKYEIPGVQGLSLKGLVNYRKNTTKSKNWIKSYTMWEYEPQSETYLDRGGAGAASTSLTEGYYESKILTGQIFVNYENVFAGKHELSALLLSELSNSSNLSISAGRRNYITSAIEYLFAGGADAQFSDGNASESGRLSYVGRINYAFDSKYLLEATLRYDGSPKFPSGNKRWGFFPSVSTGWRLSEESFMNGLDWLENFKIRGGISKTGYDGIGDFQYLTGYRFRHRYVVDGNVRTGLLATGLANPNITWEEMSIYNAGFDFAMFQNKFYGEFDVFYRDRQNMLASRILSLPNTFGADLPEENINSQTNRGFEFVLGHQKYFGDFSYNFSSNISWSRAKWEHFEEPDYTDSDDIRIKQQSRNWVNRWFGYESDGLFTSEEEISSYGLDQDGQENASIKPGDIKYIDQNEDNVLDWRDQIQIGNGDIPEVMYGINLNFGYKNFDISILGQGAARYKYKLYLAVPNEGNMNEPIYNLRWTEENNNKWAKMPRIEIGGKPNNNYNSDFWLYDADYFRIKSVNLGYRFPASLLETIALKNIRLYFSGTNLFTFSGMSEFSIDPEAPSGARAGYGYPQQKIYSFGLNVSF